MLPEQLVTTQLDQAAARRLTDEIKADAASLWAKLLDAYEGDVHKALGYTSWGAYYEAEFGQDGSRGLQILRGARVLRALGSGEHVPLPASDRVARELAPTLQEAGPEAVQEKWAEVVEKHGPTPTAAQVRETVRNVEARLLPDVPRDERGDTVNRHGVHALSAQVQVKLNELYRLVVLTPGVLDLLEPADREEILRDLRTGDPIIEGIRKALTDSTLRVVKGGLA